MDLKRPSFMTKEQLEKYMADLRQSRTPKPRPNYDIPNKRRSIIESCENEDPAPLSRTNSDITQYQGISQGVRGSIRLRDREPRKSKNGWIINTGWQIPREDKNEISATRLMGSRGLSDTGPQSQSWGNIPSPTSPTVKLDVFESIQQDLEELHLQDKGWPTNPQAIVVNLTEDVSTTSKIPQVIDIREDEPYTGESAEEIAPAPLKIVKSASPAPSPAPKQKILHSSQRPEPLAEVTSHNKVSYNANTSPVLGSTPPELEQRPKWEDRGVPTYTAVRPPTPPTKIMMLEDDQVVGQMILENTEKDKGYNVQRERNPNAPMPSEKVSMIAKAITSRQNTALGVNTESDVPKMSFDEFAIPLPLPIMKPQTPVPSVASQPAYVPASQTWNTNMRTSPPTSYSGQAYAAQNHVSQPYRDTRQPSPPAVDVNLSKSYPPIPTFAFDMCDDGPNHNANRLVPRVEPITPPMPSLLAEPIPRNPQTDKDAMPPMSTKPVITHRPTTPNPIMQLFPPSVRPTSVVKNEPVISRNQPLPPVPTFASNDSNTTRPVSRPRNESSPNIPTFATNNGHKPMNVVTNSWNKPMPSLPIAQPGLERGIPSAQPAPMHRALPTPFGTPRQPMANASYTSANHQMQPQSRPLPSITPHPEQRRPLPTAHKQNAHTHSHSFQGYLPSQSQYNTHNNTQNMRGSRFPATCTGCRNPITSRAVSAQGLRFHPECFTCSHCHIKLEHVAFFPEPLTEDAPPDTPPSGRFFCHCDFHELFSPRCKSCKTPIEGEVVVALGGNYHEGHFFCAECGDPFDAKSRFVEKDNYAWCIGCYQRRYSSKCKGCKRPVTDTVVKALDAEWHVECFCCIQCGSQFEDGRYFLRDGQKSEPVCVRCEESRLKTW